MGTMADDVCKQLLHVINVNYSRYRKTENCLLTRVRGDVVKVKKNITPFPAYPLLK